MNDTQRAALVGLLWDYLKKDREHKDRRHTSFGTKTKQGLTACIERVIEEFKDTPDLPLFECQNCDEKFTEGELINPIPDIGQRVAPGEPMPAGECPKCGALCHEVESEVTR